MGDFKKTIQQELMNNRQKYVADKCFFRRRWWNCKFYERYLSHESHREQIDRKGKKEIPSKRELFEAKPKGRFSLGKAYPVAYFSEDLKLAWEEVTAEFREDKNRTYNKRREYYAGKHDPTPDEMGGNVGVEISSTSSLLNLYPNSPLALFVEEQHPCFIKKVLLGIEYGETQQIAKIAHENNFDGIVYKSARSFKDDNLIDTNIVMFNNHKVDICWPLPNTG